MDSASQPDTPPGEPPSTPANLLGIIIAVLTLTLPLFVVSHFSSANGIPPDPIPFPSSRPYR